MCNGCPGWPGVCLENGSDEAPCRGAEGKWWIPPACGLGAAPMVPRGRSHAGGSHAKQAGTA